MIREDRKLLAELARLKRDLAFLGMCIMDGSVTAAEQQDYANRLIAAGERLRRLADETTAETVIDGEVLANGLLALPGKVDELIHVLELAREEAHASDWSPAFSSAG
ncbi:MAG: hypothetical protein ACRDRR_09125 [Pseudonocardiaceae bacterium]